MRLDFGNVTFDSDTRRLWCDGKEVHLSLKAYELLAMLIERRPHAVSKSELHDRLWPATHVSDSSLPSLISEIREAIADRERPARLIRTLHGFGYAFESPGTAPHQPAAPPMPATAQHPAAAPQTTALSEPAATADTTSRDDLAPPVDAPAGWLVGASSEIALTAGEHVLGREGPGVVLLKSSTISRRHARLTILVQGAFVEDLGSKNGTFVDDQRVTGPTPVADGSQLRVGSLVFTFRRPQPDGSTETLTTYGSDRSHP